MALVYRPTTQTIFPKNAIPWNDFLRQGVTFTFNGVVCNLVEIQMSSGGSVPQIYSQYFFNVNAYNNDIINKKWTQDLGKPYPIMYRVGVGGNPMTIAQSVSSNNIVLYVNHNLNTGDMVAVNTGSELAPNMSFFYVGVANVDSFSLYNTRELALQNKLSNAVVITNYVGRSLRAWAYSNYVPITFADKNLNLFLPIGEVNSQTFTFKPTYNRPPVGNLISYFYIDLYDRNKLLLEHSENVYSNDIEYTVDGLINNNIYYIKFTVIDIFGYIYETDVKEFSVSYNTTDINIDVTVIDNCSDSSALIEMGSIQQINGNTTGAFSYVENYIQKGNTGLYLAENATLTYDNIPLTKTSYPIFTIMIPYDGFEGVIVSMTDKSSQRTLSINYTEGNLQLLFNNNIVFETSFQYNILTTYIMTIVGWSVYIKEFYKNPFNPLPAIPVNGTPINVSVNGFDLSLTTAIKDLTPENFALNPIDI